MMHSVHTDELLTVTITPCFWSVWRPIRRSRQTVLYNVPSVAELEDTPAYAQLRDNCYGGMPIEIGYCNGTNTKLNCFEYHRDSEIDIAADDAILLVARQQDIIDGKIDL